MSIKSLVDNIASLLDLNITVIPGELRKGSTPRRCPDTTKVKALGDKFVDRFQSGLEKQLTGMSVNIKIESPFFSFNASKDVR